MTRNVIDYTVQMRSSTLRSSVAVRPTTPTQMALSAQPRNFKFLQPIITIPIK